jgi:hypothetical protein
MALNDLDDVTKEYLAFKGFRDYLLFYLVDEGFFVQKKRFDMRVVKEELKKIIDDYEVKL